MSSGALASDVDLSKRLQYTTLVMGDGKLMEVYQVGSKTTVQLSPNGLQNRWIPVRKSLEANG